MVHSNDNIWMGSLILGDPLLTVVQNSNRFLWAVPLLLCGQKIPCIQFSIAWYSALSCQSKVLSGSGFLPRIQLWEWSARLDYFRVCDPRYRLELVHGILLLVHNRCLRDSSYCDWELLMASIYAIVGDIPHMPFLDSSSVKHVFVPISRLFADVELLHMWLWFPKFA